MNRNVCAIILNYNQSDDACRAADELYQSHDVDIDVLMVDAASESDDREALRRRCAPDRLLLLPENRGYAGGMNAGIEFWRQHAPGTPVLLVTPDARVPQDVASALLQEMHADARVAAVGPVVVYRETPKRRIGAGGIVDARRGRIHLLDAIQAPTPYDADWIEGCCMLLRPDAVEEVGGFDEEYFLYYEEIDLCQQLRRANWRVRVVPSVFVAHPKAAGQQPPHYYYYMTRNGYRFWARNFGSRTARAALESLRSTLWLATIAMGSLVIPTRWREARSRWRDSWLQMRGAWAGTRDHFRATYGQQTVSTRRPG